MAASASPSMRERVTSLDTDRFFLQVPPVSHTGMGTALDAYLRAVLTRLLPPEVLRSVLADLEPFGYRVVEEVEGLGQEAEEQEPWLRKFDKWGKRIDRVETCSAWKKLNEISAEEGLVAIGYERDHGEFSRLHQFAKLCMFTHSSAIYTCPLAMTDGAARLIEYLRAQKASISLPPNVWTFLEEAFDHLTERDPEEFWTSGQWMTERPGGSDVGYTETEAVPQQDGTYQLFGFKWFTSATDANMTMTLARIVDQKGQTVSGSRGLSLFAVKIKEADGSLNRIRIARMKNKLGTRALPTAELALEGSTAYLVSPPGRGVATIAKMINVTRIYNSVSAVSGMRRAVAMAMSFGVNRRAFGRSLVHHPLHARTLANMEVQVRGCLQMTFEAVRLMGLSEVDKASKEQSSFLRLLIPVIKLYTGKQSVWVTSEALEALGGQGYIEDTGMPALLRNNQVLPIWEGTTNVLSMDLLRVLRATPDALRVWFSRVQSSLDASQSTASVNSRVEDARSLLTTMLEQHVQLSRELLPLLSSAEGQAEVEMRAREFSFGLASLLGGALLLEHAVFTHKTTGKNSPPVSTCADAHTALRWCHLALQHHGGDLPPKAFDAKADLEILASELEGPLLAKL